MNAQDCEFALRQLVRERRYLHGLCESMDGKAWKNQYIEGLEIIGDNMKLYHIDYEEDSWNEILILVENWDDSEAELESYLKYLISTLTS
jgi:hypothetical protein